MEQGLKVRVSQRHSHRMDAGGQWVADGGYYTYSELGLVGLTTSRLGSLEFILGCRLLLELRMLFALEETDSKLELMTLFLCSSEEKTTTTQSPM